MRQSIGFSTEQGEKRDFDFVESSQDPFSYYLGKMIGITYPYTRFVGIYRGITKTGRNAVLQPHVNRKEIYGGKMKETTILYFDNEPCIASLEGIVGVQGVDPKHIESLVKNSQEDENTDPACLI